MLLNAPGNHQALFGGRLVDGLLHLCHLLFGMALLCALRGAVGLGTVGCHEGVMQQVNDKEKSSDSGWLL